MSLPIAELADRCRFVGDCRYRAIENGDYHAMRLVHCNRQVRKADKWLKRLKKRIDKLSESEREEVKRILGKGYEILFEWNLNANTNEG